MLDIFVSKYCACLHGLCTCEIISGIKCGYISIICGYSSIYKHYWSKSRAVRPNIHLASVTNLSCVFCSFGVVTFFSCFYILHPALAPFPPLWPMNERRTSLPYHPSSLLSPSRGRARAVEKRRLRQLRLLQPRPPQQPCTTEACVIVWWCRYLYFWILRCKLSYLRKYTKNIPVFFRVHMQIYR